MKFKISDDKLELVIFKYLDNKKFLIKETPDDYYFLKNKDDEHAQIRIIKDSLVCYINFKLLTEIESFFYLNRSHSKEILSRYVEKTLNIEVIDTYEIFSMGIKNLKVS
jgi:hypothetical protein